MDQEQKETIRILIIDGSSREAESFLNVFRDAGFATRAHHVTSMDSLDEALVSRRKWDLLLIGDMELPDDLPVTSVLDHIEQLGRDIPAVVVTDDVESARGYYQVGVRHTISRGDDALLMMVAEREVQDLKTRRNYRRMSIALNESEKQRRHLLNDQVDAILYVSEGTVQYSNPAFNALVGIDSNADLSGTTVTELVAGSDREDVDIFLRDIEESGQAIAAIQCLLVNRANQSEHPVKAVVTPTSYQGHYTLALLVSGQDSEAGTEEGDEALQVDQPDSTTKLYDKEQFGTFLELALQRVMDDKDKLALLCITLDSLRSVHAQGGIKMSQPYYQAVAVKLGMSLIEHKACRWSDDYFMALVKAGDEKTVQALADQVIADVTAEKITVDKHQVPVQVSLGAVLLTDASSDFKTLLVRAKNAAISAMKQGGNRLSLFQARKVKQADSVEKHLAGMLSQALKNNDLKLMYQPVVSLKGSTEKHFDVQLKMIDIRGREHPSERFRNRLDVNMLWRQVDRWQVIRAGKDMMDCHENKQQLRLFFHLGGSAFQEKEFLPWMSVALKAAKIPMSSVVIEISEQNIVRFQKETPAFFRAVKSMGCSTSISDFGCSLDPLATIKSLAIDYIKLDPSFTEELTRDEVESEMKTMIKALSEKGLKIVVSNVQSAMQMAPLWHNGVDFIQGDFIQAPSDTPDFDFDGDF